MLVKSIAECSCGAFCSILTCIKLTYMAIVLSIFEWLLKTGFTVPLINADADTSSTTRGLIFSLSLYLHPYVIHVRNKDSGETAHMHRVVRAFVWRRCDKNQYLVCRPILILNLSTDKFMSSFRVKTWSKFYVENKPF